MLFYHYETLDSRYVLPHSSDFGLPFILMAINLFMIQADFLLPASGEDILRCPWNQHLLSEIPIAFCLAVKKLNEKASLRYTWARYLPDRLPNSFLSPLSETLRLALTTAKALYSWIDSLEEARLLVHIPSKFLDRKGYPLMMPE